jgi:hypothetical protein
MSYFFRRFQFEKAAKAGKAGNPWKDEGGKFSSEDKDEDSQPHHFTGKEARKELRDRSRKAEPIKRSIEKIVAGVKSPQEGFAALEKAGFKLERMGRKKAADGNPHGEGEAGKNAAYKATSPDGTPFFAKHQDVQMFGTALHEVAAKHMSRDVGLDDMVIPTKTVNAGDSHILIGPWMEDQSNIAKFDDGQLREAIQNTGVDRIGALLVWEYLAGDNDKHSGNYSVWKGRIWGLDYGNIGNYKTSRSMLAYRMTRMGYEYSVKEIQDMMKNMPKSVEKNFAKYGITSKQGNPNALKEFQRRFTHVSEMLASLGKDKITGEEMQRLIELSKRKFH